MPKRTNEGQFKEPNPRKRQKLNTTVTNTPSGNQESTSSNNETARNQKPSDGNHASNNHQNNQESEHPNEDFIEFETHQIHVPGEESSSHRRFDEDMGQMMDPFSLSEERSAGQFQEGSGLWKRQKHAVRDDWLDETVDMQESGHRNSVYQASNAPQTDAENDAVATMDEIVKMNATEKESLLCILESMHRAIDVLVQEKLSSEGADEEEDNNKLAEQKASVAQQEREELTLQDAIQEIHELASSSEEFKVLEKSLSQAIAKISNLPTYQTATEDIYSETFAFFSDKMDKFRETGIKWEFKWDPSVEETYGPYSSQEMKEWKDAYYFDGHNVQVRRHSNRGGINGSTEQQDDDDDMFGDDEDEDEDKGKDEAAEEQGQHAQSEEQFVPIGEINFEAYK